MDEIEKLRKGFNAGYLLEKHKPELSRLLQGSFADSNDLYVQGFLKGSREYMQESLTKNQDALEQNFPDLNFDVADRDRDLAERDKDFEID